MLTERTVKFTLSQEDCLAISRAFSIVSEIYDNMEYGDNVNINGEEFDRDFVENAKIFLSELNVNEKTPFELERD